MRQADEGRGDRIQCVEAHLLLTADDGIELPHRVLEKGVPLAQRDHLCAQAFTPLLEFNVVLDEGVFKPQCLCGIGALVLLHRGCEGSLHALQGLGHRPELL